MTDDASVFSYTIETINVPAEGGTCRVTVSYGMPSPVQGQAAFTRSQIVKVVLDDATVSSLRDAVQAAITAKLPPFLTGATPTPPASAPAPAVPIAAQVIAARRKALER